MVDECKTFYFAGHETTTSLLGWTILLLATHKDWQEKARKEVVELFGQTNPHSDGVARLKIVSNSHSLRPLTAVQNCRIIYLKTFCCI